MSETPCIAVLGGTGQQGRGLARRFSRAGARVVVGSRDPVRASRSVAGWASSPLAGRRVEVAENGAAIAQADIAILAVPFASLAAILEEQRHRFKPGSLVIDVTVPVTFSDGKLALLDVPEGSAAEHVKQRLSPDVRLAASFKTIPAHLLDEVELPLDCDEFVCGDSDEARSRTSALVQMIAGLRPVDVGPLARARSLEHLTVLAIAINRRLKIHDARFRVVGL
jgi:NADPH-dependent F420 reductase